MKRILVILSIISLTTPAFAVPVKGSDGGQTAPSESEQRAAARKAKEDDKAYKNALERIPAPSKKQDPWEKIR